MVLPIECGVWLQSFGAYLLQKWLSGKPCRAVNGVCAHARRLRARVKLEWLPTLFAACAQTTPQ